MTTSSWTEEPVDTADYAAHFELTRHATPFHDPAWLKVLDEREHGGMRLLHVAHGEETIALFPHVHGRKGPITFLASPPPEAGVQYLGPLFPGLEELKQDKREGRLGWFAEALRDHVRQTKVRYAQVRMAPGLDDARPFLWTGFRVTPRYTYEIDLRDGVDVIWERLKKSVRSDIRRSEGEMTIEWDRREDFVVVEDLLRRRYADQDLTTPMPPGYLAKLREALTEGSLHVLSARSEGQVVGGLLLLRFRGRMALWQGMTRGPPSLPVNDVLVWHAVRRAAELAYTSFELMGANKPRLVAFKAKFNPRLIGYLEVSRSNALVHALKYLRDWRRSSS